MTKHVFSAETAVLPLLREKDGSGTSTAEERVIGAGLKALERNDDGAAVKELFHMFAVTQVSKQANQPTSQLCSTSMRVQQCSHTVWFAAPRRTSCIQLR